MRKYSARQLRLAFMLQTWNGKMDFKPDLITDVRAKEETIDVSLRLPSIPEIDQPFYRTFSPMCKRGSLRPPLESLRLTVANIRTSQRQL